MDEATRRQVLGGTVALLGVGAGCQALFGGNDSVAPQYGTPDQAVKLLGATQALVGSTPTSRPVISNGDRTIYVDPDDGNDDAQGTEADPIQSVQAAVRRVPLYLRHQYVIDLATVPETPVRYDEDVLVPTVIGSGQAGQEDDAPRGGPIKNLIIRGAKGDASGVELGSIMFANLVGTSAGQLLFVTLTRDSPYDDEQYAVSAYGTGEIHLFDVAFTDGPTNGVLSYGSKMKAASVDLGRQQLERGIHAKRHGSIVATDVSGAVTGTAYRATQNAKITIKQENNLTGSPTFQARVGGLIYDERNSEWTGLARDAATRADAGPREGDAAGGGSGQSAVGDIWYDDGTGDADEGFYGQTADGPVQLG